MLHKLAGNHHNKGSTLCAMEYFKIGCFFLVDIFSAFLKIKVEKLGKLWSSLLFLNLANQAPGYIIDIQAF